MLPIEFKFAPKVQFDWVRKYDDGSEVTVGEYYVGNTYNCTKEPRHDALREQCKVWLEEGKIAVIPLGRNEAFVSVEV